MRSLSERRELRRSWMGGAAARACGLILPLEGAVSHLDFFVAARAAAPPIPTFPHEGGRGSFVWSWSCGREPIRSRDDVIGDVRMAGVVAGLVDDDEFAARPMLGQAPWCEERVAQVHPTVDQDARNP
jgi:hypothetical protein